MLSSCGYAVLHCDPDAASAAPKRICKVAHGCANAVHGCVNFLRCPKKVVRLPKRVLRCPKKVVRLPKRVLRRSFQVPRHISAKGKHKHNNKLQITNIFYSRFIVSELSCFPLVGTLFYTVIQTRPQLLQNVFARSRTGAQMPRTGAQMLCAAPKRSCRAPS